MRTLLVVGLGNPGKLYVKTRHNLGFRVVEAFVSKNGGVFKKSSALEGNVATLSCNEEKIHCLLPTTFMNLSGESVKKAVAFFNISFEEDLLVVVDEVYVNFGELRLRKEGGSGGHNGLKSIEGALMSQKYARLRMGIGPKPENFSLEDYVLGKFSEEEENSLLEFISKAHTEIEQWVEGKK